MDLVRRIEPVNDQISGLWCAFVDGAMQQVGVADYAISQFGCAHFPNLFDSL